LETAIWESRLAEAELKSISAITDRVSRMLSGLRKALEKRLGT
jgi:hypothetical protein